MTSFLTVFLIAGSISGAVVHFVTREPMPWWPDTAIMGAAFGAFAALGMIQHRRTFEWAWRNGRVRSADVHEGHGHSRTSTGQRSELYSAMFTSGAVGLFLLVAGLVGYETNRHAAFRAGTRWTDTPIAWEIAAGAGFLLVAAFLVRRLGCDRSPARRQ